MSSGIDLEPVPLTPKKHDPAWKHCQMFKNGDRVVLKCLYCGKVFKGGGIHRFKEHLAGHKGNGSTCLRVPPDVKLLMQEYLVGSVAKKRMMPKIANEITRINHPDEVDAFPNQIDDNIVFQGFTVTNTPQLSLLENQEDGIRTKHPVKRRRGRTRNSSPSLVEIPVSSAAVTSNDEEIAFQAFPVTTMPQSSFLANQEDGIHTKHPVRQRESRNSSPSLVPEEIPVSSAALTSKRESIQAHMAIGRFLYDVGLPMDAVNSDYFQPMIDAIVSQGSGVVAPSYNDLRGWILKNAVDEVRSNNDQFTEKWGKIGCTLLADEWNSEKSGTFLSFSVYCPEGIMFLKSVDISDIKDSPDALCETLKEAVEEVGVRNVVQVITSNDERYLIAGNSLADTYPTLYWAPCAAQCLDLMLEDFGKLEWISSLLEQAKSITRFIYNHSTLLNMMRRYTLGNDLVELGATRSATNFTTLKHMHDLKPYLHGMVFSREWRDCPYSKKSEGVHMSDSITNEAFWSSINLVNRLIDPLLRVLRIVSSEMRPAMGYVYAGIYQAKETIKKELVKREDYLSFWNIIDSRWEQQRRLPLHAAGFYLNPKFFYGLGENISSYIVSDTYDCIERLVVDIKIQDMIMKEINLYKNAAGDFGRKMAIRARDTLFPAEWWSTYGAGCPNLSHLAIRILSQTCSSVHNKLNRVPFEQLHDTRNCLERQRLSDLIFVQYNLQLRQRFRKNKQQEMLDPISFTNIFLAEDWIAEKNISLENFGSSDWMALDPLSANRAFLNPSSDDAAELGGGFDDYEPFNTLNEDGENIEENGTKIDFI